MLQTLGQRLGVSPEALSSLGACWAPAHRAWAFPMRNERGHIVGIRLRNDNGQKWAVKGSQQGLFIPNESFAPTMSPWCLVVEGPTSAAAALTLGVYPIGRASCAHGAEQLKVTFKRLGIRRVVICADFDPRRKPDTGVEWSPGIESAVRLGSKLNVPYVVWVPPVKDIRLFLQRGGTRALIEACVKDMVWKRN